MYCAHLINLLFSFCITGPGFGSLLYSVGGFGLPFWVVGALGMLSTAMIFKTLPDVAKSVKEFDVDSKSLRLWDIVKVS